MARRLATFLMFEGKADAAVALYARLFPGAEPRVERHEPETPGGEGAVKLTTLTIAGQDVICFDSPVGHEFGFTPAVSLFVDCEDEDEVGRLFEGLSEGGTVLMPLDRYPFSERYAWVADRFGVTWQLNLAPR